MHKVLKSIVRRIVPEPIRDWRGKRIRARVESATERVRALAGGEVMSGPFAGMRYVARAYASQLGPKLLGTYELEVWPVVEEIVALRPDRIVNVGAAEGYYAIGLLRRIPDMSLVAFEAEASAREDLWAVAELNAVTARLEVSGCCGPNDLDLALSGARRPLLVMDVDGAEGELLDPAKVPELKRSWILVELHPHLVPEIQTTLAERFDSTHGARYLPALARRARDAPSRVRLSPADLRAAMWEARPDSQGWLWMVPRARQATR